MNTHAKLTIVLGLMAATGLAGCSAGLKLHAGTSDPAPAAAPQTQSSENTTAEQATPARYEAGPQQAPRHAAPSQPAPRRKTKWARVQAPPTRMLEVPEVRGMTVAQATARLRSTGFKGKVTIDEMPNCPSAATYKVGEVCEIYPRVGSKAPKGFSFQFTLQHDRTQHNGGDSLPNG